MKSEIRNPKAERRSKSEGLVRTRSTASQISPRVGRGGTRPYRAAARAFTLVELVIVIVVIVLIASMFLPMMGRWGERARGMRCLQNLHQLGGAALLYAKDHNDRLPAAERLPTDPVIATNPLPRICEVLSNYVAGSPRIFTCPSDHDGYYQRQGSSYEWNYAFNSTRLDELTSSPGKISPQQVPLMYDYANVHRTPRGVTKNVVFATGQAGPL